MASRIGQPSAGALTKNFICHEDTLAGLQYVAALAVANFVAKQPLQTAKGVLEEVLPSAFSVVSWAVTEKIASSVGGPGEWKKTGIAIACFLATYACLDYFEYAKPLARSGINIFLIYSLFTNEQGSAKREILWEKVKGLSSTFQQIG